MLPFAWFLGRPVLNKQETSLLLVLIIPVNFFLSFLKWQQYTCNNTPKWEITKYIFLVEFPYPHFSKKSSFPVKRLSYSIWGSQLQLSTLDESPTLPQMWRVSQLVWELFPFECNVSKPQCNYIKWSLGYLHVLNVIVLFSVEDLEMNNGKDKPYHMSKGLLRLLSKKNKYKEPEEDNKV